MHPAKHGGDRAVQNLLEPKSAGHGEQNLLPERVVLQGRKLHPEGLLVRGEKVHPEVLSRRPALPQPLGRLSPAEQKPRLEQLQRFRVPAADAHHGEKGRGRVRFSLRLPGVQPGQLQTRIRRNPGRQLHPAGQRKGADGRASGALRSFPVLHRIFRRLTHF